MKVPDPTDKFMNSDLLMFLCKQYVSLIFHIFASYIFTAGI